MRVQIVLFDGFDPLDVIGPYEVFHTGGVFSGGQLGVELVSAEGPRTVPSAFDSISLVATTMLDPGADLIVIPGSAGSGSLDPQVPGSIGAYLRAAQQTELGSLLRACSANPDSTLATVCGGSILVAQLGLADHRPLVTHERGADLAGTAAIAVQARVVDDGDLVSSGLVTSGIDLALYLLEREVGAQVACAVESLFRHERRGTVWKSTPSLPVSSW